MRTPVARARQARIETAFTALRIEGGLFPAEFLQRVASLAAPGQSAEDYALPPGRSLRDEIGRYWSIADAMWREYRRDRLRTDIDARRVGVERWLTRLMRDVFGYTDLARATGPTQIGDRQFPLSHLAHDGAAPVLLTVADYDLDRSHPTFGDEGRRRAPHAAMQEYLNAEPSALWGIVANGPRLRLLRDNPTLTRPAFVEADLERIFEEGLYPDFAALWLMVHESRTAPAAGSAAGCLLERWRAEGAKTGQRALERLRAGVTTALRELGSGFVEHPDNTALRAALNDGSVSADALYQQLLRLVYRLLLLFTAEERGVLHAPDATMASRTLYANGYGLARLRDRSRLKRHYDRYADLWTSLTVTFRALGTGAPSLGLPALGGLFDAAQCADLDTAALPNTRLLAAIHALAYFADAGSLQRVNYRDMGTEELGSVYESLLELHPVVQVETRPWCFAFVGDDTGAATKGSERKLSGSYYTPDSLVQELLRSALDPVIERAQRDNPTDPRGALLRLRVLDPACGSGHFLLGAARRLADAVARLDMDGDLPDEAIRRHALREVVRRCIFGVDRNPLSVELCKTALWIEAIEPGKPLTFLDAHIKCGDSLIGVADLAVLKSGIPDEAFKDLTGDDKAYARDLRKRNKAERENPTFSLLPEVALPPNLAAAIAALTDAPEETLAAVEAKRRALADLQSDRAAHDLRVACDLWCAAFFVPRATRPELRGRDLVPTTDTVWRYLRAPSSVYTPVLGVVEELRDRLRFFHWPLEFPDAMEVGGFDCVLGNPPWEVMQLGEEEYFAARSPSIAALAGAKRKAAIKSLALTETAMWENYRNDLRQGEAANSFIRDSGFFDLTARGKLNTYSIFAETFHRLYNKKGRAGLIVPTGIATDEGSKRFFEQVTTERQIVSLLSFENEESVFPSVHHSFKFALLTLGFVSSGARFTFFVRQVDMLTDERRAFTLSPEDIRLINPNSRTCPIFRSAKDAELTIRIYARVPVLLDESKGTAGNLWGVSFRQGHFNMTSDSAAFWTNRDLQDAGAVRTGTNWQLSDGTSMLPLYEAKMVDFFDHRAASYESRGEDRGFRVLPDTTLDQHSNPSYRVEPFYWVSELDVRQRIADWDRRWFLSFRLVTSSSSSRTFICSVIPLVGAGNSLPIVFPRGRFEPKYVAGFLGNMSSMTFDYLMRQKIGGLNINFFYVQQAPVLPPKTYTEDVLAFLLPRVLELTFTAEDMRPWAEDLGYHDSPFRWDEDRRALLRADLDAAYAHLYGLTRDELRYILDPADIYGPDFPSETFRVLKEREIRQHGEFRTARLILAAWDRLTADGTFAAWARTL